MAIIREDVKQKAREAFENRKDSFVCFADGKTYPVKEDLKSWGFIWDAESKSWARECCSAFERFLFERKVADGIWSGVRLEFHVEHSVVSQADIDELGKTLDEGEKNNG